MGPIGGGGRGEEEGEGREGKHDRRFYGLGQRWKGEEDGRAHPAVEEKNGRNPHEKRKRNGASFVSSPVSLSTAAHREGE